MENEDKRFCSLKDMSYDDMIILMNFLKGRSKEEKNSDKIIDAVRQVSHFFPETDGTQELILTGIVTSILDGRDARKEFAVLQQAYPEMKVDRWGQSISEKKTYGGIRLSMLDEFFENSKKRLVESGFVDKSKAKIDTQIYNGKTLDSFKEREPMTNYGIEKTMFLKKYPTVFFPEEIEHFEILLEKYAGTKKIFHLIMESANKQKANTHTDYFYSLVQHILGRLEILDREIEDKGAPHSDSSREFLENLKLTSK